MNIHHKGGKTSVVYVYSFYHKRNMYLSYYGKKIVYTDNYFGA